MVVEKLRKDLAWQANLLGSIIQADEPARHLDLMNPSLYGSEVLQAIAEEAGKFWKSYQSMPDPPAMKDLVKAHIAPGRNWQDYDRDIKIVYGSISSPTYYLDSAHRWARRVRLSEVLKQAAGMLDDEDGLDKAEHMIFQAASDGRLSGDPPMSIKKVLSMIKQLAVRRCKTGIPSWDKMLWNGGGLGEGEIGVVMSAPKVGKTTLLIELCLAASENNWAALHITLEVHMAILAIRYKRNRRAHPRELKKKIYLVERPTRALTLAALESLIAWAKVRQPDGKLLVVLDYPDLMKPDRGVMDRHALTTIYTGIRGMAGRHKVPIWLPSQANRAAQNATQLGPEHISEDWQKIAICDTSAAIWGDPQIVDGSILFLRSIANRIGPTGETIALRMDRANARIWEETNGEN